MHDSRTNSRRGKGKLQRKGKRCQSRFLDISSCSPQHRRMPRQVRIEYEGAIYHCLARGDQREPIVVDDSDRTQFVRLLKELMDKTGWKLFAWVLIDNHYHLAFQTPEPNLVAGMQWLQNTWTKRFNARHGLWGHLFGDRSSCCALGRAAFGGCRGDPA